MPVKKQGKSCHRNQSHEPETSNKKRKKDGKSIIRKKGKINFPGVCRRIFIPCNALNHDMKIVIEKENVVLLF